MESELLKFKHVLEYFVTHQNYLSSNSSVSVRGYDQYLKSFIEKHNFSMTGQGYNDGRIQNQIGEWDNIYSHQICLNIQPNFGNYESKKSYLNWRGTGLNIFCNWENSEVNALSIGYAYWWIKPTQYHIILTRTISELNLYEEDGDDSLLKEFFDIFVKEINDYDTQKGDYYLKEQEYYRQEKQKKYMEKNKTLIDIVVSNYNLILTGAPGTGKTYLAKQIAAQMILGKLFDENTASEEEKEKMKEQYDFVQFHPSYDYTDFMEGLRPIDNKGNISFRRENGIFMKFCRKALNAYNKAENKDEAPKYVFVIDEINRGDLSKIFGELFFSIDPGYRGEKGKVKTQYCNLWETEKFGDSDSFYIPENVYIVGTMNDIDRSVESMDFAMRRRFAFKEVRVEDRMEMIEESAKLAPFFAEIKVRMNNLNYAILTIQGLSTAYQIGAAYFLKLDNYLTNDENLGTDSWKSLWNNHLYGLLFEYLRGLPNAEGDLDILYRAYTLEDKYKMENKKAIKIPSQDA